MSENFNTFPSTKLEALALSYVQNLNTSDLTPEQFLEAYERAYQRIREHSKELRLVKRKNTTSV